MENPVSSSIINRQLPMNFGPLKDANANSRLTGPCGDTMEYWLYIADETVHCATFTTDGCEYSIYCGSVAADLIIGMSINQIKALSDNDVRAIACDVPQDHEHCALLALTTIKKTVAEYVRQQNQCSNPDQNCGSCDKDSCDSRTDEQKPALDNHPEAMGVFNTIHNKVIVLSGKGGVGKSTVSVNLAVSLALQGLRVGVLDVDLHGPSIPTMLNLLHEQAWIDENIIYPIQMESLNNLKVISIGFLSDGADTPIIWRGPMKSGVIKQLIENVVWDELDYLIVDCPPGTGDEPLSVIQMIGEATGAVIVTTPQDVAAIDVSKSINFCKQLNLPIIGIIENMSGFCCPSCNTITPIFKSGGGERLAARYQIPFLGAIPIDSSMGIAGDDGMPYVQQYQTSAIADIFTSVTTQLRKDNKTQNKEPQMTMLKIAIPVANGQLNMHFGHCEAFAVCDVNEDEKTIISTTIIDAPPHEPGLLPRFLGEKGVNLIIAGGMGQRAQDLFAERKITVIVGAPSDTPDNLIQSYLSGNLKSGTNVCDH